VVIFTKQITTLDRSYGTALSQTLYINCAFNLSEILVTNLITFCIFFLLFLPLSNNFSVSVFVYCRIQQMSLYSCAAVCTPVS